MSPSPLLPQYSKTALLDADEDLGEGDRLLPSTSSTYPPPAAATAGGADEVVPPPPPAGYVLPPHLANYMLQGRLFLWPNKTAVCSREASRAETMSSLASAFPLLVGRPPAYVRFDVGCTVSSGTTDTYTRWSTVTDAVWEDVVVQGTPQSLIVYVEMTVLERMQQLFFVALIFGSPAWITLLGLWYDWSRKSR